METTRNDETVTGGPAGSSSPDTTPSDAAPIGSSPLGLGPPPSAHDRFSDWFARLDQLRDRPATAFVIAGVVVASVVAAWMLRSDPRAVAVDELVPRVGLTPTSSPVTTAGEVVVHVSGEVAAPGVYRLSATARVEAAVQAAGGATASADLHQLNLAALVVDGQQIRVPAEGEVLPPSIDSGNAAGPIDLNRADQVALQTLPGVGPATAEAIVAFRNEHGPFRTVDDLLDVPGIGPAKLEAIADAVVVR